MWSKITIKKKKLNLFCHNEKWWLGGGGGGLLVVMVKYLNVTSYFKEKHQTNTLHFISFDLSKWLLKYDSLKFFSTFLVICHYIFD